MHDDRLAEIQAAYDRAHPGIWRGEKSHDLWWQIREGYGHSITIADCIAERDVTLIANCRDYIRDCLAHINCCHTREQRLAAVHEAELQRAFDNGYRAGAIAQHEERTIDD